MACGRPRSGVGTLLADPAGNLIELTKGRHLHVQTSLLCGAERLLGFGLHIQPVDALPGRSAGQVD